MAMSDAERQRKRREKLKSESKTNLLVRGTNGEFDERILSALALKALAYENELPDEIISAIAKRAETVFGNKDRVKRSYINKLVTDYLTKG